MQGALAALEGKVEDGEVTPPEDDFIKAVAEATGKVGGRQMSYFYLMTIEITMMIVLQTCFLFF